MASAAPAPTRSASCARPRSAAAEDAAGQYSTAAIRDMAGFEPSCSSSTCIVEKVGLRRRRGRWSAAAASGWPASSAITSRRAGRRRARLTSKGRPGPARCPLPQRFEQARREAALPATPPRTDRARAPVGLPIGGRVIAPRRHSGCSVRDCRSGPPPQAREEADADHRQPVRDDGLGSAQEPRRLRAAGALRGRGGLDRGAEPRDRDRARGRATTATTSSSPSAATGR